MKKLHCLFCNRDYGEKTVDYWLLERFGSCVDCKGTAEKHKRKQEQIEAREARKLERKAATI